MSKTVYEKGVETLMRLRKELIEGIAQTGETGGAGMSQRLAPNLVVVQQAIDIIESLSEGKDTSDMAERMAALRAKRNQK